MRSGNTIESIKLGEVYYYWIYMYTDSSNFAVCDTIECEAVKKGKKKVKVFFKHHNTFKWKYPYDLYSA